MSESTVKSVQVLYARRPADRAHSKSRSGELETRASRSPYSKYNRIRVDGQLHTITRPPLLEEVEEALMPWLAGSPVG
jgi:hypothetical protein